MHVQFGPYHISDLEFVAAFDVDAKKVGFDLADATQASENNTIKIADVPPTEVLFADTYDTLGPHGAKSMSEAPYNPVAPALANAVRDAIGVRPMELPMSRERLWRLLHPAG